MKKIIIISFMLITVLYGCKEDWLDINSDPNNPVKAQYSQLLTNAELSMSNAFTLNYGGLTEFLSVYMHQISSREEMDQYSLVSTSGYIKTQWEEIYINALSDLYSIQKDATTSGDLIYAGIANILRAYAFSVMVDMYGDIPFSEANKLGEGIRNPKYDNAEAIYDSVFILLDRGIANIRDKKAKNIKTPEADDIIFNGDTGKWVRTANTIKLKLYNQLRLVRDVKANVQKLLSEDYLISSESQNFAFKYGTSKLPDDRHPGYLEYESAQKGYYMSPWFYEILSGYNPDRFNGIVDPRIPYYFYNQLAPDQATREGNPTEYRDGGFISIYFGSIGINRDHSTDGSMTTVGIYPVGGKYDDGSAKAIDGNSSTGAAPHRFITYADRLYIEAELINAGIITGNDSAKLREAIEASFKQVDWVVGLTGVANVPKIAGTSADTAYVDAVMAEYATEDQAGKLEIIMTEKWISSFGTSVDQYTDYRRTGYPVLFDPNNPQMAPNKEVTTPEGIKVPVDCANGYMISLPWSSDEHNLNSNAPKAKDPYTYRIFWDKN